jgi:hypothetical protein
MAIEPGRRNLSKICAWALIVMIAPLVTVPSAGAQPRRLNPLLVHQAPGTWLRLPASSGIRPSGIPNHAGGAIDPATSVLYFFGSDTHGDQWNNEVWSYDPADMTWARSYPKDPPGSYRYRDGTKTTTTGHPWAMHAFGMTAWDAAARRFVLGAWQMHYDPAHLPHVSLPADAPESWWQYDPASRTWTPAPHGPDLELGHLCYVPTLGRIVGFSERNIPVTLYDPKRRTFEAFTGFRGKAPEGYTLRSAFDSRRGRVLVLSWDSGPNVWALDLKERRWVNLQVRNRPPGDIYGSWDYDRSADAIVGLWPADPEGAFSNPSGRSRTLLVDLRRGTYQEVRTDPAPPYSGMSFRVFYDPRHEVTLAVEGDTVWSFKAPSLAPGRAF